MSGAEGWRAGSLCVGSQWESIGGAELKRRRESVCLCAYICGHGWVVYYKNGMEVAEYVV